MSKNVTKKDRLQELFLLWKTETNDRVRNKIFIEVEESFKPYIISRIRNDDYFDQQEVLSAYALNVLNCLETYKGNNNATAMTFLYFSSRRVIYDYFVRKKPIIKSGVGIKLEICSIDNEEFNDWI